MSYTTISLALAISLLCSPAQFSQATPVNPLGNSPGPPNVVLILVDDLGWSDGAAFGSGYYDTPNVDRLVREGVHCTTAYAACAVCSPSRASILTGRSPARIGVTDWIHHHGPEAREDIAAGAFVGGFDRSRGRELLTPRSRSWLPEDEVTLAEHLGAEGYATAHVGKWHLGPKGHYPENQGFDHNLGGFEVGQPPGWFDPFEGGGFDGIVGLPTREEGQYLTEREADEAVVFIEDNSEVPFFLYLAQYAVHAPIVGPPDLVEKYKNKQPTNHRVPAYGAMVEASDRAVGRVLDSLDRLGLADNTLVIYTSDNGGATHFPATDNAPLRLGKGFPYEGGLRVPFVARFPGRLPAGQTIDQAVIGTDVFATICAATGIDPPQGRSMDGINIMPLLTGRGLMEKREHLVWHFPHYWWGTNVRPYSVLRAG
ncbi:MAG: arylsulfatase A, partial [Gammaproteobacteria bacterium]